MIMFRHRSRHDIMFRSSIGLHISDSPFEDPLNSISTPDLLPSLVGNRFFRFKMNENSFSCDDPELDELFNIISHQPQSQLSPTTISSTNNTQFDAVIAELYSPMDQLIPTEGSTDQNLFFPDDFQLKDSESSQASTDSELNTGISQLSTTSPQSQQCLPDPSHSPQLSPFNATNSLAFVPSTSDQRSRPRTNSMVCYETVPFSSDSGMRFNQTSQALHFSIGQNPSTSSGLPAFHQAFYYNQPISQPNYPQMATSQPIVSSHISPAVNIRQPLVSPFLSHSQSVPTHYPEFNPNTVQFPMESVSEPNLSSSSRRGAPAVRGKGKRTAAAKLKDLEREMNNLEYKNNIFRETIINMQREKARYEAMFREIGFTNIHTKK